MEPSDEPSPSSHSREEWMILADLTFTTSDSMEEEQIQHDWHTTSFPYTNLQISEMPSWLTKQKQTFTADRQASSDELDIGTFSSMQSLAYDLVKEHFNSSIPKSALHLIINGVAGTGKSYLISAFKSLLQRSCVVPANTGKAAFSISGITIHSLLNLPVGPRGKKDLAGQSLARLQVRLLDIKYVLIDEYSMSGQTLLGWIDKRCRQATGIQDHIFGGISLIFFGDPAQLPPVGDKPLYHSLPSGIIAEQGHLAYLMFRKEVKLSESARKRYRTMHFQRSSHTS